MGQWTIERRDIVKVDFVSCRSRLGSSVLLPLPRILWWVRSHDLDQDSLQRKFAENQSHFHSNQFLDGCLAGHKDTLQ